MSRSILGLGLMLLAGASQAQSLYGIDSTGIVSTVTEFTGPPSGACLYPDGPVIGSFGTAAVFGCPVVGPFVFPTFLGDVAFDTLADTVWATDGVNITQYTTAGVPISSFTQGVLGPLTGLGFDSLAGLLWMTDGSSVAAITPPVAPGCAAPTLVWPPFGVSPVLMTDVDWDPKSGTLWICDIAGHVWNVFPGGAPGAFGFFSVIAGGVCPLTPLLTGIAYDAATPTFFGNPPAFHVTDGFTVAYLTPPGPCAPSTFPTPICCSTVPTAQPVAGLAHTSHGITFGTGVVGTGPPVISSSGNTTSPGLFTVHLDNAAPFSFAGLKVDFGPAFCAGPCPPAFMSATKTMFCYCGGYLFLATGVTNADGELDATFLIPSGLPYCGLTGCTQWFVKTGTGLKLSQGLWFTLGSP